MSKSLIKIINEKALMFKEDTKEEMLKEEKKGERPEEEIEKKENKPIDLNHFKEKAVRFLVEPWNIEHNEEDCKRSILMLKNIGKIMRVPDYTFFNTFIRKSFPIQKIFEYSLSANEICSRLNESSKHLWLTLLNEVVPEIFI